MDVLVDGEAYCVKTLFNTSLLMTELVNGESYYFAVAAINMCEIAVLFHFSNSGFFAV